MPIELHSTVYHDTVRLIELAEQLLSELAPFQNPALEQDCLEVALALKNHANLLLELELKQHNARNRPQSGQKG